MYNRLDNIHNYALPPDAFSFLCNGGKNRIRRFNDATRWSFESFSGSMFACVECDIEYTEKYAGISDIHYGIMFSIRKAVSMNRKRKSNKRVISSFR